MREPRAALPDDVKIEAALALGWARIASRAPARSATGHTDATGPKISSRAIVMAGSTESKTEGPRKKPSPAFGVAADLPSSTRWAPSEIPLSM